MNKGVKCAQVKGFMEEKIKQIINRYNIGVKNPIILAVSGGVDSVVLLDLFAKNVKQGICVAHVNHGLRKESGAEEIFVRNLAEKYGATFYIKRLHLSKKSEDAARQKRYKFLRQIKEKVGAKYILTAHHLNDQAETVLLNLTRGTGPVELWGMEEREEGILRPLLSFSKKEIISYAKKQKLKWVEDASNKDKKYARNRIRMEVIPKMEKINPNFLNGVRRETELAHEMKEFLDSYISKSMSKIRKGETLNISLLKKESIFIQKEIVRMMIFDMAGCREDIYSKNIAEVLKLLDSKGTKYTKIKGFTIEKSYDRISFGTKAKSVPKNIKLSTGETQKFGRFTIKSYFGKVKAKKNNILLSPKFPYNLTVRTWQPGDRIKTSVGTKKIQDIFTNAKVPMLERGLWPIVISGKEIIWVPMLQASAKTSQDKKNNLIIEARYEK